MLTISGKSLGRKRPLFADWSSPLPPSASGGEGLTLRQLISHVVREQVELFRKRQADNQVLRVLTERQIAESAERGRVAMGQTEVPVQSIDEDGAIGAALQAFEDGLYLVVIDEVEQKNLDALVHLTEESRITFVRLALLAGG